MKSVVDFESGAWLFLERILLRADHFLEPDFGLLSAAELDMVRLVLMCLLNIRQMYYANTET